MERTELIQIRVSPAEKERIRASATAAGAKLSEYVRAQALGSRSESMDSKSPEVPAFDASPERSTPNRTIENVDGPDSDEVARLTKKLQWRGMTTRVARREARKQLGG